MFSLRRCLQFQQLASSGQKVSFRRRPRGSSSRRKSTTFFTTYPGYWKNAFDGRIRNFDEIPGPEPSFSEDGIWRSKISGDSIENIHQMQANWIKQYGHVVREYVSENRCIIHLHHPEDMMVVHLGDPAFKILDDTFVPKSRCRQDMYPLNYCNWLAPSANVEWSFVSIPTGYVGKTYGSIRTHLEDVVEDFVVEMHSKMDGYGEIDILPWLFRWAFESIGLITMSIRLGALSENQHLDAQVAMLRLKTWKDAAYSVLYNPADIKNIEEMQLSINFLSRYVYEIIEDPNWVCLVDTYHKYGWNPATLVTFLIDVFQQGAHKLSYAMAYTLLNIAANSNAQACTRAELKNLSPRKDSDFYTPKEKMTDVWNGSRFIRGIIEESLRLSPPIYGTTEVSAEEGLILGGYDIPVGNVLVLHRQFACRQERYFPKPLRFNPWRFIPEEYGGGPPTLEDPDVLYHQSINAFTSTTCLMEPFSDALMTLFLSRLIRNFEISCNDEEVKIVRTFYNEPAGPIKLKLKTLV